MYNSITVSETEDATDTSMTIRHRDKINIIPRVLSKSFPKDIQPETKPSRDT